MARKRELPEHEQPGDSVPANPEPPAKNPHARAVGKLGGLKGGKARAKKLTPEQRAEIAEKAAARWGRKDSRSGE